MNKKILAILLFLSLFARSSAQNFGSWSGTIRMGGGLYGSMFAYFDPVCFFALKALPFTEFSDTDLQNTSSERHRFFRFLNIGGDILLPNWTISSSKNLLEIRDWDDNSFLNNSTKSKFYYWGYTFNWKSAFSRFGFSIGADYEYKNFLLYYPDPSNPNLMSSVHRSDITKIHSLVPTFCLRYRLVSPSKEIEGFPFNVVLEGGFSYLFNIKYENEASYGLEALNNGIKTRLGIAITTNRYGCLHVRWTKELFNLYNKDYNATQGPLYNDEITNDFSCYSIGWSLFL